MASGEARESLLDSYEAERRPVAQTVLRGTDRGFALEVTGNAVVSWLRSHVAGRLIGPLTRLPAARAAMFRLFSQTWIGYRGSPAVFDRGPGWSSPRAGDRAPYARFESAPDSDLFGVTGGTGHYALLFEGLRSGGDLPAQERAIEDLLHRYLTKVGLRTVPVSERRLHVRYRARRPRLFLIRPDGHIAYAGPPDDLAGLAGFLDRIYVRR